MKGLTVLAFFAAALLTLTAPFNARADDGKSLTIESMLGKYDGIMEIHMVKTLEFSYQAEILPVENNDKAVSLVAHCDKCEPYKDWKRNNCAITGVTERIKFTCKGKNADEMYIFDGERLKMSGYGAKYPFSINAKKIPKE